MQSNILGNSSSPGPLDIQFPYDECEYLNQLGAYNCNQGVDIALDLAREIQSSGNYYYQGLVFPNLEMIPTVAGLATINGVAVVSPGAYVVGISAICYTASSLSTSNAGFNLKIYDKGSKASIFYGDYAQHQTVAGHFDITQDDPKGPALLKEPFILTGPGIIGWEIVNRSSVACMIQVLIDCAVPITNRSIQNTVVSKG